jgi:polar amino acid transport system substrate-binding protein
MSSLNMSPLMKIAASVALLVGLADAAIAADDVTASRDVAPTGSLRVAIAVDSPRPPPHSPEDKIASLYVHAGAGPAGGITWAARDVAGEVHGVTVELAKAAAARLNVPLQLIQYETFREILAAATKDAWDISFMSDLTSERVDTEDQKFIDQGPFYIGDDGAYLVRADSDIKTFASLDRSGIRVGSLPGSMLTAAVRRSLKHATLITTFDATVAVVEALEQGRLDALAEGSADAIILAKRIPGTHVIDEYFQYNGAWVVVPKSRPAARDWATRFMEDAKADGTVRRALDSVTEADLHYVLHVARPTPRRSE